MENEKNIMIKADKDKLGAIVASEDGRKMSWFGETKRYWATFDTDPAELEFEDMPKHIIQLWEYDKEHRPEGATWFIAFLNGYDQ